MRPTKWYYRSVAEGPIPCRWEGWVDFGAAGWQWLVIDLFGG